MVSPSFLVRVGLGLAATTVERVAAFPGRTLAAVSDIPAIPVRLASDAAQAYMHANQAVTEMAIKGDALLNSVFSNRQEQPAWVTFDEDEDDLDPTIYGHREDPTSVPAPEVPTGSVRPRR